MVRTMRKILPSSAAAALAVGVATLHGAAESPQAADAFARKVAIIVQHGTVDAGVPPRPAAPRRTPVTESEVNSWFAYRAQPLLPQGLAQPRIAIIGGGRVMGTATVDLEAVGKSRSTGGTFDVWRLLGGRMPVNVTGILHTKDGEGRFELQSADVSGVPLPKTLLQEVISYYSRTPEHPQGIRLDDAFELPANIKQIEVGQGQAVVVQ
jgi:hypothetical protein